MLPRMDRSFSAVPNHLKAYAYSLQICFAYYIWFLNQYLPYSPVSTLRNGEKEKIYIYKKKERDTLACRFFKLLAWLSFFFSHISSAKKAKHEYFQRIFENFYSKCVIETIENKVGNALAVIWKLTPSKVYEVGLYRPP